MFQSSDRRLSHLGSYPASSIPSHCTPPSTPQPPMPDDLPSCLGRYHSTYRSPKEHSGAGVTHPLQKIFLPPHLRRDQPALTTRETHHPQAPDTPAPIRQNGGPQDDHSPLLRTSPKPRPIIPTTKPPKPILTLPLLPSDPSNRFPPRNPLLGALQKLPTPTRGRDLCACACAELAVRQGE